MVFRRALQRDVADLLEELARLGQRSAEVLRALLEELPEGNARLAALAQLEGEADGVARELIGRTGHWRAPRPLQGGGAHLLAHALDDIIDELEEVGARLFGYGVEAPLEQALAYLQLLCAATEALTVAVREVRQGRPAANQLRRVEELEHEGDRLERDALASLYREGVDPLIALRWSDLLSHLERALDRARAAAQLVVGLAPA